MPQAISLSGLFGVITKMAQAQKQELGSMSKEAKIMNLMQFARKAGKLSAGTDACLRELHHKHIHLIIVAADTAERTVTRVKNDLREQNSKVMMIELSSQQELSAALGLHLTGVYGISDKNFAAKMIEYWQS